MLSTPPTSARLRLIPSIIPAASMAPIMLVAHAITVENAGIAAGAPASIHISRAMLLHVKLGPPLPQTQKSGWPLASSPSMCRTTGTDRAIASSLARGPSTFANAVLTPAANQTSGRVPLRAAISRTSSVWRQDAVVRRATVRLLFAIECCWSRFGLVKLEQAGSLRMPSSARGNKRSSGSRVRERPNSLLPWVRVPQKKRQLLRPQCRWLLSRERDSALGVDLLTYSNHGSDELRKHQVWAVAVSRLRSLRASVRRCAIPVRQL